MKALLKKIIGTNDNEEGRNQWLEQVLAAIRSGQRILDAGTGELRSKPLCTHLNCAPQDICEYEGTGDTKGLQTGIWSTSRIDLVCDIVNTQKSGTPINLILCGNIFENLPGMVRCYRSWCWPLTYPATWAGPMHFFCAENQERPTTPLVLAGIALP